MKANHSYEVEMVNIEGMLCLYVCIYGNGTWLCLGLCDD
jgi:hypothetical protein